MVQKKYKPHPLAQLLPEMSDEEYKALLESVRSHGLRDPIVLEKDTDLILDGRHRYRAACEAGKEVLTRYFEGNEEDKLAFVLDMNLKRRHLNESQRAMVAASIAKLRPGDNQHTKEVAQICATTQTEAAEMLNTSRRAVQQATVVQMQGTPALQEAVSSGVVSVSVGEKVARMPEEKQKEFVQTVKTESKPKNTKDKKPRKPKPPHQILATMKRDQKRKKIAEIAKPDKLTHLGKFPVLYADPPWLYEKESMGHTDRAIENHYTTMTLEEICALPVSELATEDAILFLWVTAPQIEAGIAVMKAWGFDYKTNMVWVKDKMGTGYHVRNQHELLFIGKRGKIPLPEPENVPPSVVCAPRMAHSAKPEHFYEIIEKMYPDFPKIELFSRSSRKGWKMWGMEAK